MRRPFRFQYSLSTLLLVVTITCMTFSLFLMYRELRQARLENQSYRNQFGFLSISDPDKPHAIQIPTNENCCWRWRIYLPPGRIWHLSAVADKVPPGKTFPSQDHVSGVTIPSGEHTVFAGVIRELSGKRVFQVSIANCCTMGLNLDGKRGDWLDDEFGRGTLLMVPVGVTVSTQQDEPLELLRLRHTKRNATGGISYQLGGPSVPTDGFLVWIEEENSTPHSVSNKSLKTP